MWKLVRGLTLVAAMTAVSVAALSVAEAQDKEKKGKTERIGTVEVYKDKGGGYRFRVKDTTGKTLASCPKGYKDKAEAVKALELVKETLNRAKVNDVD
jgi:uncharacterized protein YegP (UPF0339 family)